MGGGGRRYADLAEIYEELEYAESVHKRLGCPVIEVSNLAIEETARRIVRIVEERRLRTEAPGDAEAAIPWYCWPLWMLLLAAGLFVFYVLLTPVWVGIA